MNTRNTSLVAAGGQEGSRDQREQSGPDVRQKSPGSPAGVVSSNPEQSASTCPVASPVSGPQKQQENVEEETEGGEATVVGPEPAGDTSPAHQKAVRATHVLAGSEISTRIRSRMKTEAESKTDHELGHELPQEANAAGVPNPSVVVKQSPASPKLPRGDDDAAADSKELAAASVAHAPDGQPPVEMPGKAATSEGKGTENKRNQQVGAASTDASSEAQANTAQAAKGNATDDLKRKGQERDGEGRHKSSVGKRMKSEVRR